MKKLTPNLMVENVDTTIQWYKDVFDAEVIMSVPYTTDETKLQWAMIAIGEVSLMFQLRASLEGEIPALKNAPIGGSFTMYIDVTDVKTLFESVKSKVKIVQDMHTTFYGSEEFAIEDCDAYILAFSEQKQD